MNYDILPRKTTRAAHPLTTGDELTEPVRFLQGAYMTVSLLFLLNLGAFLAISISNWSKFSFKVFTLIYEWDAATAHAEHSVDFNAAILVIIFFSWSFLCFAYLGSRFYTDKLLEAISQDRTNVMRWVTYFGAAPQIVLIAIMCGIRDSNALLLIALGMMVVMFFGMATEDFSEKGQVTAMQYGGNILYAAIWTPIVTQYLRHAKDAPWFVHVIFISQIVMFTSFGLVNAWHTLGERKNAAKRLIVERVYLIPDVVSKLLVSWLLVGGLLSR